MIRELNSNKVSIVKIAESSGGTGTYREKLNQLYNGWNQLNTSQRIMSFIMLGTTNTLWHEYNNRYGSASTQVSPTKSVITGFAITSNGSSAFETTIDTNGVTIEDKSQNTYNGIISLYALY